jgi:SsrA-binding protein
MSLKEINIVNRKAGFHYELLDSFTAGLVLMGTEIKSIRHGKANLTDGFGLLEGGELWMKNILISAYSHGNINNHEEKRDRKLLLNKSEIKKISRKLQESGTTIVPLRLFINEKGIAKMEIALARGKKTYDKRDSLKDKDVKRDLDRAKRR